MKSSLVILYHREPYDEVIENGVVHYRDKKSPNGIMPTLKSFFANVTQGTWVAWKQVKEEDKANFDPRIVMEGANTNYNVRRIPLLAEQVKHFYHITSKEAFWPLLHSFPYHHTSETSDWDNFQTVNRLFAEAACEEAADDALIWVHDYNLWLAPGYIRQMKPNARIAFFHHTPFPSVDVFNILPWREAIIDSLLCCDICGFHIPRYAQNFVSVARSLRKVEVVKREPVPDHMTTMGTALAEPEITSQIRYNDQLVTVDAFPVGTNPQQLLALLDTQQAQAKYEQLKERMGDRKLLVAAGRVDYVKGMGEILECYERLLERRPELHGTMHLVVACAPAAKGMRIYEAAQAQIEQLASRVNGRFATLNWTPVLLFAQALPYPELLAHYKAADICWTTPLRDGLNLVAKEYVISRKDQGGVLILSEFVGAAVEMPEAVLTNPYSTKLMDAAIDEALAMSEDEQKQRMGKLYETVTHYDVRFWAERLFQLFGLKLSSEEKEVNEPALV